MTHASRPLRILHCPTNVGGNPQGLATAERAVGLDSWAVTTEQSVFNYEVDEVLFAPGDSLATQELKRIRLLMRALRAFDVVHFNFGRTIFPVSQSLYGEAGNRLVGKGLKFQIARAYISLVEMRDLPLLKRAGKGIFVTYQGSDARQGDYCLANFPITHYQAVDPGFFSPEGDRARREAIATFNRYADGIYSLNPDLMHVLPARAKFMAYGSVDPAAWQPTEVRNEIPLVLHAPSHRGVKGTPSILAAVEQLRCEGIPFEFTLVENMPNAEARSLYARADLVIDQLLAGWYGALAVEVMALGKPAICYLRDEDLHFLPPAMKASLPLIPATPDTITDVLRSWLTERRGDLAARGRASRAFVEAWHDPTTIARSLKHDYEAVMAAKRG